MQRMKLFIGGISLGLFIGQTTPYQKYKLDLNDDKIPETILCRIVEYPLIDARHPVRQYQASVIIEDGVTHTTNRFLSGPSTALEVIVLEKPKHPFQNPAPLVHNVPEIAIIKQNDIETIVYNNKGAYEQWLIEYRKK